MELCVALVHTYIAGVQRGCMYVCAYTGLRGCL